MSRYIALLHRADGDGWGISFPDFPGCVSAGDTYEETIDNGAQALRFHVEGMIEDGDAIPAPTPLEKLQADKEFAEDLAGAIVSLVTLLPPRAKPMRVNVSLDSNLLVEIDAAAQAQGMNRSEFLAEGARQFIVRPARTPRTAQRPLRPAGHTATESRKSGARETGAEPRKIAGRGDAFTGSWIARTAAGQFVERAVYPKRIVRPAVKKRPKK